MQHIPSSIAVSGSVFVDEFAQQIELLMKGYEEQELHSELLKHIQPNVDDVFTEGITEPDIVVAARSALSSATAVPNAAAALLAVDHELNFGFEGADNTLMGWLQGGAGGAGGAGGGVGPAGLPPSSSSSAAAAVVGVAPPKPVHRFVIKWYLDEIHEQRDFIANISITGAAGPDATAKDPAMAIHQTVTSAMIEQVFQRNFLRQGMHCFGYCWSALKCIETVKLLRAKGFRVCLVTEADDHKEKILTAALKWCITISQISDGMCHLLNLGFTVARLENIITNSIYLPKYLVILLHDMMIAQMAIPEFKMTVAEAYIRSFGPCLNIFSDGVGLQEANVFSFSVQFLNRPIVVHTLVQRHNLFDRLMNGFTDVIHKALGKSALTLASSSSDSARYLYSPVPLDHIVMRYRRYIPVISDLKVSSNQLVVVVFMINGRSILLCFFY